jgi:lysine-N-methylase
MGSEQKERREPKARRAAPAPSQHEPLPMFREGQRFACRDCPARCCRMPWRTAMKRDDAARIAADPWVRERLSAKALRVLEGGVLPMVERDRRPACAFLDEDEWCGLQKEKGHNFIPRACQVFPFDFARDENGRLLGSLSRLCPSVRDDYGDPALEQLSDKLEQQGAVDDTAATMSTLTGVSLRRAQYFPLVERWEARLEETDRPLEAVAELFDWMSAFELALPEGREKVDDETVQEATARADEAEPKPLKGGAGLGYRGRMLFAHVMGHLCYPARVALDHRIDERPWWHFAGVRALLMRLSWLLMRGTVDLIFVDRPVPLGRLVRVAPPVRGEQGRVVAQFLVEALRRRQLFSQTRPLQAVLLDLALAAVLTSRFARCRAAAAGATEAAPEDVAEGLSIAELMVISHVSPNSSTDLLQRLRWAMLSEPLNLRRILGAEAS